MPDSDYDSGSALPPGLTVARNDSDLPEDVVITCSGSISLPPIGGSNGEQLSNL